MTTHLRTRAIQVGALLAMVGGALAVAATPALADDPTVQIVNVQATDLPAGGRTTMNYSVTNNNELPAPIRVTVDGNGMGCSGDCSPQAQFQPGETKQFNVQLTAPNVGAGQTRTVTVRVNATAGNDTDSQNQDFTVRGADKPQTVTQVEGRVKDQDGKAVGNANVGVRDSAGHSYQTTTGGDGRFVFRSSDANPILAGTLQVGAVKQGFNQVTVSVQGTAGKSLTVPLTLEATAAAPAATPSAIASVSAPPTEDATDAATGAAALPSAAPTDNAAANQGSSHSLLFIILGALLVAAGVGAIVLVVMRRKSAGDDPDDPIGATAVGGVVPPSRGAFHDATRVAAPIGGRNDATMAAGRPSISDAPTMMQQAVPVEDEFPDPYGVPAPQAGYGGYGGAAVPSQPGGYDPGPPTQFEDDPYAAYGAGAGYADTQRRFDEPTGMYRPEQQGYGGYPEPGTPTGSYGAGAAGYGREPDYPAPRRGEQSGDYRGAYGGGYGSESWAAPAGGIDSGNGYGPAGGGGYGGYDEDDYPGRGTYGGPPAPASTESGGYGYDGGYRGSSSDAGYGRSPDADYGYGRAPDADYGRSSGGGYRDQGGYDQDGGYYGGAESGGGRHGGQSRAAQPESTRPGQRRSLDWLDD